MGQSSREAWLNKLEAALHTTRVTLVVKTNSSATYGVAAGGCQYALHQDPACWHLTFGGRPAGL
jgi:hypothetical protein